LNRIRYFILIIFLASSFLYSQTKPCILTYKDGSGIRNARLIGLHQDLLLVSDTGSYKIVNIEKIKNIRFNNGTYMIMGAAFGAVAGFLGGIVYYELFHNKKRTFPPKDAALGISLVFTIPGALVGGLVGNFFKDIDDYDFTDYGTYMKSKEIKFIMRDHSQWR
jgi:hypothetical protein